MKNHSFNADVACEYGVNAAILLQNIFYWCEHNAQNDTHFYDGRYWTYNSLKAFCALFPYMGEKQIRNALAKLKDAGLIVSGSYNKSPYDKTLWYAITEDGVNSLGETAASIMPKGHIDETKGHNREVKKGAPIPNINTDINTDENAGARAGNPFGDDDIPNLDTVYAYASNNLMTLGHRAIEEITSYVNDLSEPVVRHAIDNALDSGVRTWKYVKAILERYVDAGVKSVVDAKAADAEFENRRHGQMRSPQKTAAQLESERFWSNVPRYD